MKNFTSFLIVFILLLAGAAKAQPVINLSWLPQAGDTFIEQPVKTAGVSVGSTGANQVWDYTSLIDTGSLYLELWVEPSATPAGDLYPNATIAGVEPSPGNPFETVNYFYISADTFFRVGVCLLDTVQAFSWDNGWHDLTFPQAYGNFFAGSYNNTDSSYADISSTVIITNGTGKGFDTVSIDGYGTLKLPDSTYNNVIRLSWINNATSTSVGTDFGITTTSIANVQTLEVQYLSSDYKMPLLDLITTTNFDTSVYDGIKTPVPPSTKQSYMYAKNPNAGVSTGITKTNVSNNVLIYPNPTTGKLIVQYDGMQGGASARIMDMTGRTLISNYETGSGQLIFDVHSLPAGMYLVELTQGNMSVTNKFIKVE